MNFKIWLSEKYDFKDVEKFAKEIKQDVSKYDKKELVDGINTEKEHEENPKLDVIKGKESKLLKIALAHLEEDPHYYKAKES